MHNKVDKTYSFEHCGESAWDTQIPSDMGIPFQYVWLLSFL